MQKNPRRLIFLKELKSKMSKKKKKILIGMSGGVDSSVSAALLKKQGFDVLGIFLKLWKADGEKRNEKAAEDAKQVAKILSIPLKIIDARKKFKKEVVGYFLKEYAAGRTPNPCIFCNENLKFKILFELADKLRADYVATGHYARLRREFPISNFQFPNLAYRQVGKSKIKNPKLKTKYKLCEASDKNKDQSYFLYRLKQKQLAKIIFPLGNYKKEKTRKLAKKFGLPNFDKEESQDICFLGKGGVVDFLKKYLPRTKNISCVNTNISNLKYKKNYSNPLSVKSLVRGLAENKSGKILDKKGNILGKHFGLSLYTIGQRKGINIGGAGPYFVVNKDYAKNRLTVANGKKDLALFSKSAELEGVNWILDEPKFPARLLAQTRYRNPLVYATISKEQGTGVNDQYKIKFEKMQRAVTPGQSIVFYNKKGEVIGGGIIHPME
jgi:tRNA-uridine 2-sulfurtransferase